MRIQKTVRLVLGLIPVLALLFTPMAARADEWNEATKLTFSQPMEIPGHKILAAGTYWFVTMADLSAPNVVRILNADRSQVMGVFSTGAVERAVPTDKTEIDFARQANEPNALVSWFYPSTRTGHEFLYGRPEEAAVASEPVLKVMAGRMAPAYGD